MENIELTKREAKELAAACWLIWARSIESGDPAKDSDKTKMYYVQYDNALKQWTAL